MGLCEMVRCLGLAVAWLLRPCLGAGRRVPLAIPCVVSTFLSDSLPSRVMVT